MPFDASLGERARIEMAGTSGLGEKKMFGGLSFLVNGNMACGVIGDTLIVRVGPDAYADALTKKHTRVFDFTGRVMKGWVVVEKQGYAGKQLAAWVERGRSYAQSLPPKRQPPR